MLTIFDGSLIATIKKFRPELLPNCTTNTAPIPDEIPADFFDGKFDYIFS